MVIYLGYIINEYPALNFFAYILTSLKWQHCLTAIIFRNIFVHAIIGWLVFSQWECLLTGFFEQPIRYHFLLAWNFLFCNFCVLLIIFKYSIWYFSQNIFSVLRIVLLQLAGVWPVLAVMTLKWCPLMLLYGHYGCSWTSLC